MRHASLARGPIIPDADDVTSRDEFKRIILATVDSIHPQDLIRDALLDLGSTVKRIEKHWFHDVWEVRLLRSPNKAAEPLSRLRRRILLALEEQLLHIDRDSLVVSPRGRQILIAFVCRYGEVGIYKEGKPGSDST